MPKRPTQRVDKEFFNKNVSFYLRSRPDGTGTYQLWLIKKEGPAHSGLMHGIEKSREFVEALGKRLGLKVEFENS